MKALTIRWQRLVDEKHQTCARCEQTGDTVEKACYKLKKALAELGIDVLLQTQTLDLLTFAKDPLQSNRIWIGGRPLEEWVEGTVGQSPCCDACGDSECRTISIGRHTFEAIPEDLIIRAGLLAASELFKK